MSILFLYFNIIILIKCQLYLNITKEPDIKYINQTFHSDNSSENKKNIILGIIEKYSLNTILPFFKSYIYSEFKNCDLVIFVRNVSTKIINYLKSIGVIVYEVPSEYKRISTINVRWKMYINYLNENKNKYNLVFSADVRDTYFQKDVFENYKNHEPFLGVAIEDDTLNEKYDKKWIIDYVGVEKHKIIQHERIICVGTLWGTYDKFLEFSIMFWDRLISNPNAIEQGIANYMFYYEKIFKDCILKSDNFGPVMTIGVTKRHNLILDSQDNILNFEGEIASVIHQYDRKPDIVEKVLRKFCPEILQPVTNNNKFMNQTSQYIGNISNNYIDSVYEYDQIYKKLKKYKFIIYFLIVLELITLILLSKMTIHFNRRNGKIVSFKNKKKYKLLMI